MIKGEHTYIGTLCTCVFYENSISSGTYKHRIGPDRAQLPDRTGSDPILTIILIFLFLIFSF